MKNIEKDGVDAGREGYSVSSVTIAVKNTNCFGIAGTVIGG